MYKKDGKPYKDRSIALTSLPKTHLHLHLEGAIRSETIMELYHRRGNEYANLTLDEVTKKVQMTKKESSFSEFLIKFPFIFGCVDTQSDITRFTREIISDSEAEGVRYVELRFCPHSMKSRTGIAVPAAIEAVIEGLHAGMADCPNIIATLIIIIDQGRGNIAAKEAVYWASRYRDRGISAVDIAGDPTIIPLIDYSSICTIARDKGLGLTVHAGELQGAESVRVAVEELGASRIGHGIRSIEDPSVLELLLEKRITLEVCVTSNIFTRATPSLALHPLIRLLNAGVLVTINSDDPLIFNTSLVKEYKLIQDTFGLTLADFKRMNLNAVDVAFVDESKRKELRSIIEQGFANIEM